MKNMKFFAMHITFDLKNEIIERTTKYMLKKSLI